ncbi:MAG: nucleotidyltransferase family protein [Rhodobacteraceae bacterium]|nr:nucleotidyltransferase family protein [Paracoccaceae bacterium]
MDDMGKLFTKKRIFPFHSWAWPKNGREDLIKAAIHPDEVLASRLFAQWMRNHNIDDVSWGEQRLLLAVAQRFPGSRLDVENRARLNGLVRVFWTKSKLALRAAEPAIAVLQREGIECLIFKGAARTLDEATSVKGRVANDVDIMVQPACFVQAIEVLCQNGWQAENGFSQLRCRARARGMTGLNFLEGDYGDVDLHQSVVHRLGEAATYDQQVWEHSKCVDFQGNKVRVPGQTDQLLIAIQHGGVEGHAHSDWLLDCVVIIQNGHVDWDLFLSLCQDLDLNGHALIALNYIKSVLEVDVPQKVLSKLSQASKHNLLGYFSALFQARSKDDHGILSDQLRSYFKQRRLRARGIASRQQMTFSPPTISLKAIPHDPEKPQLNSALKASQVVQSTCTNIILELMIPASEKTRRYEFELNTDDQHIARLTYKHRSYKSRRQGKEVCLSAKIKTTNLPNWPIDDQAHDVLLTLEARPRKVLKRDACAEERDLNMAIPFSLLKFEGTGS